MIVVNDGAVEYKGSFTLGTVQEGLGPKAIECFTGENEGWRTAMPCGRI